MFRSRRRRTGPNTAYRATFWTLVIAVILLGYLDRHPLTVGAEQQLAEGTQLTDDIDSGTVVVLDYDAVDGQPDDFSDAGWNAAWINLIEQEIGPATIATPTSLSESLIDDAHTLVLTSSVSGNIPESLRQRLRSNVMSGMTLVLEQPDGALREAYSANGEAGRERGHRVTLVRGLEDPYASRLEQLPVATDYIGSTAPKDRATTLLAIDGAPVVYTLPVGDGDVVTIEFDVGEQLVSLQQGRPSDGFRLGPSESDRTPRTWRLADDRLTARPPDRESSSSSDGVDAAAESDTGGDADSNSKTPPDAGVASDAQPSPGLTPGSSGDGAPPSSLDPSRDHPYADILERFLVWQVFGDRSPVVGYWPYPAQAPGALLLLHSDTTLGDDADWMLAYETARGATSTLLSSVDAGLSASGAAVIDRRGGEHGLIWRPAGTSAEHLRTIGMAGLSPLATPKTLGDQLEERRETLPPDADIDSIRRFDNLWSAEWARPFHIMEAQGISYDTSYRPRRPGYSWGTGLPFRPITRRGRPLSVREIPVIHPHDQDATLDLGPLLKQSRDGDHQVLTVDVPPSLFGDNPSVLRFERWLEMFEDAERFNHWITDLASYRQFAEARRSSSLDYEFQAVDRIPPTASEQLEAARQTARAERGLAPETSARPDDSPDGAKVVRLRIEAEAERDDLALTIPTTTDGYHFQQARRRATGSAETAARQVNTERTSMSGTPVRTIPLDTGTNTIDVYYSEITDDSR